MLAQCFYELEDFASLTKLVDVLTEGQPLLADIGRKLQSVGLCSDALASFLKVCTLQAVAVAGRIAVTATITAQAQLKHAILPRSTVLAACPRA